MILFFQSSDRVFAVHQSQAPSAPDIEKFQWLFDGARFLEQERVEGYFVGPRRELITPWSTTAVEITQNVNLNGVIRIETFFQVADERAKFDPMLERLYHGLDQEVFLIKKQPDPIVYIEDIRAYNAQEGLALNEDEIAYLIGLESKLGRKLSDSEVFGFSQVNSEHCRHKIFNGTFVIDGVEKESTLFQWIKRTSKEHPNRIVSAYKDNCAFIEGPEIQMFYPKGGETSEYFGLHPAESVISIKAETHNFPTTVEPFNGAATGSGGEIRDRIAGGNGSYPVAGTAVYMTSYPRFAQANRPWEQTPARKWLYQTPTEILMKASNGASDFGNKFGQALICGSLLTFEHTETLKKFGFDKVIMLAGGIGYAKKQDSIKGHPKKGDKIVLMGGDNYRIGMGGGAVSSVATGEFANAIELNAVQRSNPEMQKRVQNAIRALIESEQNPIVTIHDHGAGGHLNCLSELVEETGGRIDLRELPVGDPTLSAKELVGNESQERMGMIIEAKDIERVKRIAERERAPMYVIGETTGDMKFTFENPTTGEKPIDWALEDMFGSAPKTILVGETVVEKYPALTYESTHIADYLENVLQIEAVACKDWLTNKVDRSVTGLIAMQQTAGEIQLPLNNLGMIALDYQGRRGVANALGHAPVAAMIDASAGSRLAIAEALTNIIWAPIEGGLKGISLSANWMWPCRNEGEDARLYEAVQAASDFCVALGINIPTGKDSLSMTQKYPDGEKVLSPGSVLITAAGEVSDIRKAVSPVLVRNADSVLVYMNLSGTTLALGGSSFAQTLNGIGDTCPDVSDPIYFAKAFNTVQELLASGRILSGHDISAGGLSVALLEMCFANASWGIEADLSTLKEKDSVKAFFSENPGLVLQIAEEDLASVMDLFAKAGVRADIIGRPIEKRILRLYHNGEKFKFEIDQMRDLWYKTSYLFDAINSGEQQAKERYANYKNQVLQYSFPKQFQGSFTQYGIAPLRTEKTGIRGAIIREKGINGDREMAWMMHLAGMDVKDVHMTDLISGREDLKDVNLIVFVGGFSNSDVLGSAKGWAGSFLYNPKAKATLDAFFARKDTLSLGVCNGCQLMIQLGLITPQHAQYPRMEHNRSHHFETGFVNVSVPQSPSVLLESLQGARLGIWVAHGEGRFNLPYPMEKYNVALQYSYDAYPNNPNGSPSGIAGLCSDDGRHLAMMPHPERCTYPWNWPYYPAERKQDDLSPWIEIFINAKKWIAKQAPKR